MPGRLLSRCLAARSSSLLVACFLFSRLVLINCQDTLNSWLGDFCARPGAFQETSAPGPLDSRVLEERGLELAGLQALFRHGSRSLLTDLNCWKNMEGHYDKAKVHYGFSMQWPEHGQETGAAHPLLRQYTDVYPQESATLEDLVADRPSFAVDQLLEPAPGQYRALAQALRRNYFSELKPRPRRNNTWMYATETARSSGSLYLLQHFLFEDDDAEGVANEEATVLHTRPLQTDPWALHGCSGSMARFAAGDVERADSVPEFQDFASRWKRELGTDFVAGFKDCLVLASCTDGQVLQIPPALAANGSALLQEAMSISGGLYHEYLKREKLTVTELATPALIQIQRFALAQARGEQPAQPLALWGTHDTTLAAMLEALGAWDGVWPPYSETILLETYRATSTTTSSSSSAPTSGDNDNASSAVFVRLLRRGKALRIGTCKKQTEEGLCALEDLLSADVQAMSRHPCGTFTAHAAGSIAEEYSDVAEPTWSWLSSATAPVISAACLLLGLSVGFIMGKRCQDTVTPCSLQYGLLGPEP